ncbi:hypothetical protein [Mycolicibacterium hippocampi]|uniref:ATP-dependent DNA helicase RecQ n=1 Tax=Mycolicibacterium hippocampi TaxID=659824 RepID=A0A850PX81_9MYCO|nr:hypothetical protein [Mycolicibacterium hippocampi]NVN52275.1 ATP-dependent DNA helicase RecQ [Mycolicibacterium hippocampi]
MAIEERTGQPTQAARFQCSPAATTAADFATLPHTGVTEWDRRRLAAARCEPLNCGCRDPWVCRCRRQPLSHNQIDAAAAAAEHLECCGLMPIFSDATLRALWTAGHQALAERLHHGGEVA